MQFCGFSNAWHPCIPSHNRHWGSNFRVHGMASDWGLFAYGVAGAFGRQVLQGSDRRWAYYRQVPLSMYKIHQLELSTLVWVTWWFSENTFALCCCLHLWSFVDIIYDMFVWFCFYTHAAIFQLVVTPRWAATLDFVSVTCQRSFRDILGSSFVIVSIYGADLKTRGVKRGQHFCLMTRSIPIKKRGSFHFIPCRLIPPMHVSVSTVSNS